MIYLACPYSHPKADVRDYRYRTACRVAAALIRRGDIVFSPLSHSVPIAQIGGLSETDTGFWLRQDLSFLRLCDQFMVLCLPGWDASEGINGEIAEAKRLGIPVQFISESDIDVWQQ